MRSSLTAALALVLLAAAPVAGAPLDDLLAGLNLIALHGAAPAARALPGRALAPRGGGGPAARALLAPPPPPAPRLRRPRAPPGAGAPPPPPPPPPSPPPPPPPRSRSCSAKCTW